MANHKYYKICRNCNKERSFPNMRCSVCTVCKNARKAGQTTKKRKAAKYKPDKDGRRPPKTRKERKFAAKYIENGGNGTQAALSSYDTVSPKTAAKIGNTNTKKLTLQDALRSAKLTDKYLADKIRDGLEAKKLYVTAHGNKRTADHNARHKYLETALRLKGHGKDAVVIDQRKQYVVMLPKRNTSSSE